MTNKNTITEKNLFDWMPNFTGAAVSTDTRTLKKGDIYIALVGENFNGHDFLQQAYERGAAGAIVNVGAVREPPLHESPLPLLTVPDTRIALGQIAKIWRNRFSIPVIALTGSCGKTTTKTMLASILSRCGETLVTEGTLNNDIGVPLTILKLTDKHQYAVIEIGTNHFGEIAYATNIAQPTIAAILNAGPSHLEFLGDIAGVAREKSDIYQIAQFAIINLDDVFADNWTKTVGATHASPKTKIITFSAQKPADVWASDIKYPNFKLHVGNQSVPIQLSILGQHNVSNALAAAALVQPLQIPLDIIKAGLEAFSPVSKRLVQKTGVHDCMLIDDTYNANPSSFRAALDILVSFPAEEKILIMGDMGELGPDSARYHKEIGQQAKIGGINQLYGVGRFTESAVEAFGHGGHHFPDQAQLIQAVTKQLHEGVVVLVKGSKSSRMGNIVEALM